MWSDARHVNLLNRQSWEKPDGEQMLLWNKPIREGGGGGVSRVLVYKGTEEEEEMFSPAFCARWRMPWSGPACSCRVLCRSGWAGSRPAASKHIKALAGALSEQRVLVPAKLLLFSFFLIRPVRSGYITTSPFYPPSAVSFHQTSGAINPVSCPKSQGWATRTSSTRTLLLSQRSNRGFNSHPGTPGSTSRRRVCSSCTSSARSPRPARCTLCTWGSAWWARRPPPTCRRSWRGEVEGRRSERSKQTKQERILFISESKTEIKKKKEKKTFSNLCEPEVFARHHGNQPEPGSRSPGWIFGTTSRQDFVYYS